MDFDHLMHKVRHAASGGINVISTGEALAAALVLNRPDWLANMGYTIAEALDRIDQDCIPLLSRVAKQWELEQEHEAEQQRSEALHAKTQALFNADSNNAEDTPVLLTSKLVTYGHAPGYRDTSLLFDVEVIGQDVSHPPYRIELRIRPEDGETIVSHLLSVHRSAWDNSGDRHTPIDVRAGEVRPRWIDRIL